MKNIIHFYTTTLFDLSETERQRRIKALELRLRKAFWNTEPASTHNRWIRLLNRKEPLKYISLEKAHIIALELRISIDKVYSIIKHN